MNHELRKKLREDINRGIHQVVFHSETVIELLDLLDRYEAALDRIGKTCAARDGLPDSNCDCLNWDQCADIAGEALSK